MLKSALFGNTLLLLNPRESWLFVFEQHGGGQKLIIPTSSRNYQNHQQQSQNQEAPVKALLIILFKPSTLAYGLFIPLCQGEASQTATSGCQETTV